MPLSTRSNNYEPVYRVILAQCKFRPVLFVQKQLYTVLINERLFETLENAQS